MSDIEQAFQTVRTCEDELAAAATELQKATTIFGQRKNGAEKRLAEAWKVVESIMVETGEYQIEFPPVNGLVNVIYWTTPRQSVKVVDAEALPDDLVKIERVPDKKAIAERLKQGWATNAAVLEYGDKRLTWKAVKHAIAISA